MSADRTTAWDNNKVADLLFGPSGGMAIWVRREEGAGRACVRKAGDPAQTAMDLAALKIAFDRLIESIAAAEGITPDQLSRMVRVAETEMSGLTDHATRIKPGDKR